MQNEDGLPRPEPTLLQRRLKLDLATIMAVNDHLAEIDSPVDSLHGRVTLEFVKGEFTLVEVTCSHLLKQKRNKKTA